MSSSVPQADHALHSTMLERVAQKSKPLPKLLKNRIKLIRFIRQIKV